MNQSRARWIAVVALAAVLVAGVLSAGCVSELSPLPNEVKNHGNLIAVNPQYVSSATIMTLLWSPEEYEPEMFQMIDRYLDKNAPVLETGVGIGVIMAYIENNLMPDAYHIALEPNPYLKPLLEETIDKNGLEVDLRSFAIAYPLYGNTVELPISKNLMKNTLSENSPGEKVSVVAADIATVLSASPIYNRTDVTLVIEANDVLSEILKNEGSTLKDHVKTIIAETWGMSDEQITVLTAVARENGYRPVAFSDKGLNDLIVLVFTRQT